MTTLLPLFPLPNVVLFPGMLLPLHIFEPRYCDMMTDILQTDGRFGLQFCQEYNPETLVGVPFDIGTVAEILEHQVLEAGRFNVLVLGRNRFRVADYDHVSKPYLQGNVTWLVDDEDVDPHGAYLLETGELFQEALRLTHKLLRKQFEPLMLPKQPEALSYFVAEHLRGSLVLKQVLLEMESTQSRLAYEHEVLTRMVRTLVVRTQIEDIFDGPSCD